MSLAHLQAADDDPSSLEAVLGALDVARLERQVAVWGKGAHLGEVGLEAAALEGEASLGSEGGVDDGGVAV